MKRWYVYEIPPIDFEWENLQTVKQVICRLAMFNKDNYPEAIRYDIATGAIRQFLSDWEAAKKKATQVGWEGDFREEPVVIWLPFVESFHYGFVIKQDNSGITFVISPVPMNWLDEYKVE